MVLICTSVQRGPILCFLSLQSGYSQLWVPQKPAWIPSYSALLSSLLFQTYFSWRKYRYHQGLGWRTHLKDFSGNGRETRYLPSTSVSDNQSAHLPLLTISHRRGFLFPPQIPTDLCMTSLLNASQPKETSVFTETWEYTYSFYNAVYAFALGATSASTGKRTRSG